MAELPPLRSVSLAHGNLTWREAGQGMPLVLLHGIGSGSASWRAQLAELSATFRVMAWDAPGYGASDPLPHPQPTAVHYAQVVHAWLASQDIREAHVLGHSLGALVAATWCAEECLAAQTESGAPDDAHGVMVRGMVLASPAQGYGRAAAEVQASKFNDRMAMLDRLGIDGMAEQRSAHLCAPHAAADVVHAVQDTMRRITRGGYRQAAWMLAHDDLPTALKHAPPPLAVMTGELDGVTPPDAGQALAQTLGVPFVRLQGVGHASYVEDPAQFNAQVLRLLAPARPAGTLNQRLDLGVPHG